MTDVHDRLTRSRNMSAIKCKDTKPEMYVRLRLFSLGYRYRLNNRQLPGRPDITLRRHNAVIFVNGCFWHLHNCPAFKLPLSNTAWWRKKLEGNRQRDERNIATLRSAGWRVCIIWECSIRGRGKINEQELFTLLSSWLESTDQTLTIEGQQEKSSC